MTTEQREQLGRIVRETWIAWAKEQPDTADHPHWLTKWGELSERDKEVDRRIGEAIYGYVIGVLQVNYPQTKRIAAHVSGEE